VTKKTKIKVRLNACNQGVLGCIKGKGLMNRYNIPQVNNSVCEAVDCCSPAEVQIKVKVGQVGSISLSLCNDCVRKFRNETV